MEFDGGSRPARHATPVHRLCQTAFNGQKLTKKGGVGLLQKHSSSQCNWLGKVHQRLLSSLKNLQIACFIFLKQRVFRIFLKFSPRILWILIGSLGISRFFQMFFRQTSWILKNFLTFQKTSLNPRNISEAQENPPNIRYFSRNLWETLRIFRTHK